MSCIIDKTIDFEELKNPHKKTRYNNRIKIWNIDHGYIKYEAGLVEIKNIDVNDLYIHDIVDLIGHKVSVISFISCFISNLLDSPFGVISYNLEHIAYIYIDDCFINNILLTRINNLSKVVSSRSTINRNKLSLVNKSSFLSIKTETPIADNDELRSIFKSSFMIKNGISEEVISETIKEYQKIIFKIFSCIDYKTCLKILEIIDDKCDINSINEYSNIFDILEYLNDNFSTTDDDNVILITVGKDDIKIELDIKIDICPVCSNLTSGKTKCCKNIACKKCLLKNKSIQILGKRKLACILCRDPDYVD